jgi:SAM-dependent methyltransferase
MSTQDASTWHYGVVARWWAEFNVSGPEIDYFQRFVEAGQPALDVACGTGRLLLPYLRAGLDVDGCDVSADMVARCREAAEREGLTPNLYVQAMHELDLPRRYRTVFVCGGFGLGSTREQDREGIRRFHDQLEPGGLLVLDNEVPYADAVMWQYWLKEKRQELP